MQNSVLYIKQKQNCLSRKNKTNPIQSDCM